MDWSMANDHPCYPVGQWQSLLSWLWWNKLGAALPNLQCYLLIPQVEQKLAHHTFTKCSEYFKYSSGFRNFMKTRKVSHRVLQIHVKQSSSIVPYKTSWGGRMSRLPTYWSGRSGNPKIAGLSLEPAGLKPGWVKPKSLKLILVPS